MQTELTDIPERAAAFVRSGGVVAFPTETVYGLGADVFNADAIAKIFEAKRRPADNPLIAHIGNLEQIGTLAVRTTAAADLLIDKFFPGPLTLVLEKVAEVPLIATAGLDTLGIRMPSGELAQRFLQACGTPVAAPSANVSGRPSPTTWEAVFEDLNGRIDCILKGDPTEIGLESTVVDCTEDVPTVLRAGAISIEDLRLVLPSIRLHDHSDSANARSPGMRHKHYAPLARVVIWDRNVEIFEQISAAFIGLKAPTGNVRLEKICDSVEEYARSVFAFFRECDHAGIETIYCERVGEEGLGAALMDRISRAAER